MTPNNIPVPVPPAQPTDLAGVVEAAARELKTTYSFALEIPDAIPDMYPPDYREVTIEEVSAILLRHLQRLAEQLELQTTRCIEREERLEQMAASWDATKAQLTAAQEELSRVKQERDALRIEYESRVIWIAKMNKILGYDNSDGFHSEPDPFAIATALQSAHAKGAEDGKRLNEGLTYIYNEVEGYEDGAPDCGPKAKLANAILPTIRSLLAIVRARSAKPEPPAGYTAEELDRDNPYNAWTHDNKPEASP